MGALYCLLSAAGFGLMAVFAKSAYDEGVSVPALLLVRFALAAVLLLAIAASRGALRGLTRRAVLVGLAMGVFGYAVQASFYFSALQHLDASLVALVFYVYPVTVMVASIAVGRERASVRRVAALLVALGGIGLVLAGAATGQFDTVGVLLSLGAAATYTGYIVVGDRVTAGTPPVALAALVCTGATGALLAVDGVRGLPDLGFGAAGWGWLAALVLISTVASVLLFFAGLAKVGPSTAAILSILEPVVTVLSAAAVFGETLTAPQWGGGLLVLAAVVLVQLPARGRVPVVVPGVRSRAPRRPARAGSPGTPAPTMPRAG
ncbi:DMT family transporter [Nocardioides nitrophenolicus]|uniref:DMT family transporter n=1 Tax=Nocardioides nitrophenolicus TaxID=60489 RepID=UPI00195750F7|nr:DMT family transporter [Nocardioides nitrophenolicus]MBM7517883.1 drug/metabolite transporter (DMT)-like permease [Nocardioides nitrophenolicus]